MPEGNRKTPVTVPLNYTEYSLVSVEGYDFYTFYVAGDQYLELPLDANVRLPSENSIPYKEMVKTLVKSPEMFFLQNSGISVIATDVKIRKNENIVELKFSPETGIVNGGHTQLAILSTKDQRDISKSKVKIEVIKHEFDAEELATIAASRNTASNVKPYSTAEKKGLFVPLKQKMHPKFEKHIIWYENRDVPNGKGFSAMDLIALLNLFDIKNYQSRHNSESDDQPNKSATSKGSVFKDWENDPERLLVVYPLIDDIINLMEHIESTFHKNLPKGFTHLDVIKEVGDSGSSTLFTGRDKKWELPKQFLLPLLAAFRAVIKYDSQAKIVGWYMKPEDAFDSSKNKLTQDLMKTYRTTYHNEINRASKDGNLWRILYSDVNQIINPDVTWKMYAID